MNPYQSPKAHGPRRRRSERELQQSLEAVLAFIVVVIMVVVGSLMR